jgi:K+-sensing histidine kinase KdpD
MVSIPNRIVTRDNREGFPVLQSDINLIYGNKVITSLLDSMPLITMVLNNFRQVLFCNRAYLELTSSDPQEIVLGLRPGELFGCAFHAESPDGCGESEYCRFCGAVAAVKESQLKRGIIAKEVRLTLKSEKQDVSVDFKINAAPFETDNKIFTIVTLENISDSKRRKVLEQVFFHDIIDKVTSLEFSISSAEKHLSDEKSPGFITLAHRLSQELISEILGQRILLNAENNELKLTLGKFQVKEIIARSIEQIKSHQISMDKTIIFDDETIDCILTTDYLLLNRVLINMLKNALEASVKDETVTISYIKSGSEIEFRVHNTRVMSEAVKVQVFQRSFSTKGFNRGIGTYSMKLLGEQFLKGKVWFESGEGIGTFFYFSIPQTLTMGK